MRILTVLIASLIMAGCHKQRVKMPEDEPRPTTNIASGFSEDVHKLNGYLTLTELRSSTSVVQPGPGKTKSFIAYALFREPANALTETWDRVRSFERNVPGTIYQGIVSVDEVHAGIVKLTSYNHQHYRANFSFNDTIAYAPYWSVKGNKTFHPFNNEVNRGFPEINDSLALRDTVFAVKGYTLHVRNYVSGHDSVMVYFRANNGFEIILRGGSSADRFVLSPQQVGEIWQTFGNLPECYIVACNYMHRKVNGKAMQFENCRRLRYQPVYKS